MTDSLSIFATSATAIIIESAPFLLLGSLIGAAIEVFVSDKTLVRFLPKNAAGQIIVGLLAGMVLPTCECGIVPVARRLLVKGVPPRTAIPYMMAAPVVNPVVIASTLFAFRGDVGVVLLRILLVLIPATAMGLALGRADPRQVLRARPIDIKAMGGLEEAHSHDHHDHCGCGHDHGQSRILGVLRHGASEFISMLRFLVFGAVAAAAFKAFLPPDILGLFADNAVLAVAGLMLLAILLSVCSEADAFVAASFAPFPMAAKLAFMAVGPLVDLKLIPMFFAVFHKRLALALVAVPVATIFIASLILHLGSW